MKKVGEDDVGKGTAVALQLLRLGDGLQVLAGLLGLDVTDNFGSTVPHAKVGVAGLGLLGKHGHVEPGVAQFGTQLFQQALQRRVKALFAVVPALDGGRELFEVAPQRFRHGPSIWERVRGSGYGPSRTRYGQWCTRAAMAEKGIMSTWSST